MAQLWTFKHTPKTLEDYIATPEFKEVLKKVINELPNCILYGPPGTGKSSFVSILTNTRGLDVLQINASDEAGVNTIRDKVKPFAYSASFNDYKIVYLNECERLSNDAMEILRSLIEEVHDFTRFILVANDISGLHEAILSRCQLINFSMPDAKGIAKYVINILKKENVSYDDEVKVEIIKLVKSLYPDIRRIIGTIQASVVNGKILRISNTSNELLNELVTKTLEFDIEGVREILRQNSIRYVELYTMLFEQIDKFAHPGDAIIEIGEALYRDKFVANKEINYLAMMCKIMKVSM